MSAAESLPRPREVVSELGDDEGVSIPVAAMLLGSCTKTVRRMIAAGELDAWRVSARGSDRSPIRVRLGSIRAHKARATIVPVRFLSKRRPARVDTAANREALRYVLSFGRKPRR